MGEKSIETAYMEAWNDCENPPLDGINPHFKNRYATLKATLAEVRKACKSHRLAYMQTLMYADGEYRLESSITDGATTMKLSTFPIITTGNPQQFGSEMTYRKRQQAQADWGIVGEEDDDGEAAVTNQEKPKKRTATPKQLQVISRSFQGERLAELLNYYDVESLEQLTITQASELITRLKG